MRTLLLAPYDMLLFTALDDDDYDRAIQWEWHVHPVGKPFINGKRYVIRNEYRCLKPHTRFIYMHRWLMGAPVGLRVDHINGDGLDNRRSTNLRIVTGSQNSSNQIKPPKSNRSGYWGVSWDRQSNKWMASIMQHYKKIYIGMFDDKIEAALAYDRKAIELRGPITHLNFPNRV